MASKLQWGFTASWTVLTLMKLRHYPISAALVLTLVLPAGSVLAQAPASTPASAYGGVTVEDIIARVNDQIITRSDYDRAMKEMDQEGQQRGDTRQQIAEQHDNLLRNLIDQQLWLSKGKELGITGETELIKRLDDIRKQYHLATLEDLEKAAQQQGVSFEDFKQNIRNQIITQNVMRQEVGRRIQFTPGDAERYYEAHKQDYMQPESVRLSEILISTGATDPAPADKLTAAKAKAADLEARLSAGGDFAQLARSFSDGSTAASGGDLGEYKRGQLPKLLEEKTFDLKAGQFTAPILTRQGYIILKVVAHTPGGPAPYKSVENQVEDALYMARMEPAIRAYLTKMREEAFIDIKPGYIDAGASPNETKPVYSAYTPPSPKKKRKVERTRFRETARGSQRRAAPAALVQASEKTTKESAKERKKRERKAELAIEKPGKKEKIRYGQAPRETLPPAANTNTTVEDAGAATEAPTTTETAATTPEPVNPLETAPPEQKSRFSDRAREHKEKAAKAQEQKNAAFAATPPSAAEVADRQTQSAPLGLAGDTATKKKAESTTGDKTRFSDEKRKKPEPAPQTPPTAPQPQQ